LVANVSADVPFGQSMDADELDTYFKSETGRKSLSAVGDANSVSILGSMTRDGVYYIHTQDNSEALLPDTTNNKWRGFFPISERMVSISPVNFVEKPLASHEVLGRLQGFAARIKLLNSIAP